jgi:hypothetical protein
MAVFFSVAVAIAVMFVAGLAVIPTLQEADAANTTSESRDKGARGELMSEGKHNGNGRGEICPTCG